MSFVRRDAVEKGGKKQPTCDLLRFLSVIPGFTQEVNVWTCSWNVLTPVLKTRIYSGSVKIASSPFLDSREVTRNSCAVSAPSRLTRKGLLAIYSVVDVLNYDDSKMIPAIQTLPRVKRPTYYHPSTTASQFIRKLKLPEIRKLLQNSSLDILAVAETKLANAITDGEIGIEGYFAIRRGRHSNCCGFFR